MRAKIYEYKERSLICRRCLKYGHNKNNCQNSERYAKCGELEHNIENGNSDAVKCVIAGKTIKQATSNAQNISINRKSLPYKRERNPHTIKTRQC